MRLGINGWRIQGLHTGVRRYLVNVLTHWTAQTTKHEITVYTPKPFARDQLAVPENIRQCVLRPQWRMLVWENLRLSPVADDDVLFCPSHSRPLLTRCRKVVVSMFDAVSQLHPELFPRSQILYNRLYGWSGRHAALVIAGSEASRQDIARAWGIPLERIRVTYLAAAESFRPVAAGQQLGQVRKRHVGADVPFFLFVGKISGRRRLPPLLEAFSDFKTRTAHPHKLLLVGLNPRSLDLGGLALRLGISEHVKYSGFVSDDDLNLLYNAAQAMVMPSVYETLSLPVMEAQACGTPVICIDTDGMREITGGAAILIARLEPALLFEAMVQIAEDPALRQRLSAQGLAHAGGFSWQRCSARTLQVLEEAATM